MRIRFACPGCQRQAQAEVQPPGRVTCEQCDWGRDATADDFEEEVPRRCLVCGCDDLWRQKDFPQVLGLLFVVAGGVLSTIAWAMHRPATAIGILMGFALVDLLLYAFMGDMLVCYRCRARHRRLPLGEEHASFDLEVAERYRQQELRLKARS